MTAPTHTPEIRHLPIADLTAYANNARLHPKKQVQQIAGSIRAFGFINPIIIDEHKVIIAGHGRYEAAKLLGLMEVPTIIASHLSEAQVRAYRLADNQLALNSEYDEDLLKVELGELAELDLDFDLEIIGFETAEIDQFLGGSGHEAPDPADQVPAVSRKIVTQPGDIWQLGKHRLICGDATQEDTYAVLMQEDRAQAIITDPPYNVRIDGNVCGTGKIKHREFAMASGEMTDAEYGAFLDRFMAHCKAYSADGSLHYIFIDWRHVHDVIHAGHAHYQEFKNICVWAKQNAGLGSMYRSQHEFAVLFKHGKAAHINNIELGKYGRYRTNVWSYAGVNSFGRQQEDLQMHPTVKPVAMLADAIKDCTRRGQIVLDAFAGSGSTLIACEGTGRVARCIELDPVYCDVIVRRWQERTGDAAILVATGQRFDEVLPQPEAAPEAEEA